MNDPRDAAQTDSDAGRMPMPLWLRSVVALSSDVGVALFWAALMVAIVLFSGAVSQFAYVDF